MKIKAALNDIIERADYARNFEPTKFKTVALDNVNSKEEFLDAFENCIDFFVGEWQISFTMHRSDEEIDTDLQTNERFLQAQIRRLRKACENEVNKSQIFAWLEYKKMYWLLKEINK